MNHGRILAALSGAIFLGGSLAIILGEALLHPMSWGQSQVLTVLMITGTIAAGHLAKVAFKARSVSCVGFAVLFVCGSGLVVYNSVGRQAEQHDTVALERAAANSLIEDKTRDIESARDRLAAAERNADRERGSKCKTKCKDWENAAADARNVIRVLESEIKALGAPRPLDSKASKAGEVAAAFGYERHRVEVLAALLEPFFWTVFFELGTIVSLGFAFHSVSTVSKPIQHSGNSGGGGKAERTIRLVHEDHELVAVKKALQGGRSLTNDEIAAAMGLRSKGEASKRVTKCENLGIVRRERIGKHVRITLCHAH